MACPIGERRFKRDFAFVYGVFEREFPGEKVQGAVGGGDGLGFAQALTGEVKGVAQDGPAEVPEMDSDLVGAAGVRGDLQECCAIGMAMQHQKRGTRSKAVFVVHHPGATFAGTG